MTCLQPIDHSRRPQRPRVASLTAAMVVRGAVSAEVLHGSGMPRPSPAVERPVPPPPPVAPPSPAPVAAVASCAVAPAATQRPPRKAVTVRLDPMQHLRLRLVGCHLRQSAQYILEQALDAYLDGLPPLAPGGG